MASVLPLCRQRREPTVVRKPLHLLILALGEVRFKLQDLGRCDEARRQGLYPGKAHILAALQARGEIGEVIEACQGPDLRIIVQMGDEEFSVFARCSDGSNWLLRCIDKRKSRISHPLSQFWARSL